MSKRDNFVVISHRNFITSINGKEVDIKEGELRLISKKENLVSEEDVEDNFLLTKGETEGRRSSH